MIRFLKICQLELNFMLQITKELIDCLEQVLNCFNPISHFLDGTSKSLRPSIGRSVSLSMFLFHLSILSSLFESFNVRDADLTYLILITSLN